MQVFSGQRFVLFPTSGNLVRDSRWLCILVYPSDIIARDYQKTEGKMPFLTKHIHGPWKKDTKFTKNQ